MKRKSPLPLKVEGMNTRYAEVSLTEGYDIQKYHQEGIKESNHCLA
jgi:hypothetical protein